MKKRSRRSDLCRDKVAGENLEDLFFEGCFGVEPLFALSKNQAHSLLKNELGWYRDIIVPIWSDFLYFRRELNGK